MNNGIAIGVTIPTGWPADKTAGAAFSRTRSPIHSAPPAEEKTTMTKTLAALIVAAFAAVSFNVQAASHAGGAPMAAAGDKPAAAAPAKKVNKAKKAPKAKKAAAAKAEEAKK